MTNLVAKMTGIADAPFHSDTADVVFKSSDGVKFYVHKIILTLSSEVFSGMLDIPRPVRRPQNSSSSSAAADDASSVTDDTRRVARPAVTYNRWGFNPARWRVIRLPPIEVDEEDIPNLAEDSVILDLMLRFCYPVDEPTFTNLKQAISVLAAMDKYVFDEPQKRVRRIVHTMIEGCAEPVSHLALVLEYNLHKEVRLLAKQTLRYTLLDGGIEGLEVIPAASYHRLLRYHQACAKAVTPLVTVASQRAAFTKGYHAGNTFSSAFPVWIVTVLDVPEICISCKSGSKWLQNYLGAVKERLIIQPGTRAVTEADFIEPFMLQIDCEQARYANNTGCRSASHKRFPYLVQKLRAEIDRAIEYETLGLRFPS